MTNTSAGRRVPGDWYAGVIPENVRLDDTAYVETSFSFALTRSRAPVAVRIGKGSSIYLGSMFDLGPEAEVQIGAYALINGARIICDAGVSIGDYALISWNVVLMDSYRWPSASEERRRLLERLTRSPRRGPEAHVPARPIRIERNVWIGFDACVLPGVCIGEGSIVAARSVVVKDVEPNVLVAGNPARTIRRLEESAVHRASH